MAKLIAEADLREYGGYLIRLETTRRSDLYSYVVRFYEKDSESPSETAVAPTLEDALTIFGKEVHREAGDLRD